MKKVTETIMILQQSCQIVELAWERHPSFFKRAASKRLPTRISTNHLFSLGHAKHTQTTTTFSLRAIIMDYVLTPVVLDNGSGMIKAGYAGEEIPKSFFPS